MSKTILKLLFLLFSSFMVMFFTEIYTVFIIFIILLIFVIKFSIDLPLKYIILLLLPVYFIFGLTYMIEYGFTLTVFKTSFFNSSLTLLKLLNLILLNIVFIKTTSFIELSDTFMRLKLSKKFLFSIMILTSIIPLIFKTAKQIYDAQRLRGLRKRDFLTIDGWILFLSPLFIHIFSYSQQIALQLELKNYENTEELKENIPKVKDYTVFVLLVFSLIFIYYVELNYEYYS